MTTEALLSGRIKFATQDGSREFLSLLACICADGTYLPPSLIFRSDSGSLQDTWLEDWNPEETAYFTATTNGWSCSQLGFDWLNKVFDPHTRDKARFRRRLLIVDGHSSHVNWKFMERCDALRVLVIVLPPHSTHRLQPLDISLFSPLATAYTNGLNKLMFDSLNMISMSKRTFWSLFYPAWLTSFTSKNIVSGFEKAGIFPYNPHKTLDIITKPKPSIQPYVSGILKTPLTSLDARRIDRACRLAPTPSKIPKLLRAIYKLTAVHELDTHEIQRLQTSFRRDKKKKKRGIRLNLLGEEDAGPQFFDPDEIMAAREFQKTKKDVETRRQQDINDRKVQAAAKKKQKEQEKEQRKIVAAESKAAKTAERQVQNEFKKAAQKQKQQQATSQIQSMVSSKARKTPVKSITKSISTNVEMEVGEPELMTSRGRRVQRPQRFVI